jgi:uncharacterized protein YraI
LDMTSLGRLCAASAVLMVFTGAASATPMTTSSQISLRDGPDNHHRIVGAIPRGAHVTLVASHGNWCRVRWAHRSGYVRCQGLVAPRGERVRSSRRGETSRLRTSEPTEREETSRGRGGRDRAPRQPADAASPLRRAPARYQREPGTAAFPGNDTPGHAGPKAYQPNIHPARPVVTPAPHVSPLSPNGGVKLAPSVISPSPSIARPGAPQAPVVHPLAPAPHVSAPAPAAPAPALAVKPGG